MQDILYDMFVVFKFIFGLGALLALVGIGLGLVWFLLHIVVRFSLRGQPANSFPRLRQLFLGASS